MCLHCMQYHMLDYLDPEQMLGSDSKFPRRFFFTFKYLEGLQEGSEITDLGLVYTNYSAKK